MRVSEFVNFRKVSYFTNLYRTGEPLDESIDLKSMIVSDIDMYIDLRNLSDYQICENSILLKKNYVNYCSFPLKDKQTSFFEIKKPNEVDYAEYYLEIFYSNIRMIRKIFSCIAKVEFENLLIGCKFGKDRTGIIIYLLLVVLDINESIIFFDYTESAKYLKSNVELRTKYLNKSHLSFNPNHSIIEMFDQKLKQTFPTKKELISYLGLDQEEKRVIRRKFL